jgi:hypothetical protein
MIKLSVSRSRGRFPPLKTDGRTGRSGERRECVSPSVGLACDEFAGKSRSLLVKLAA